MTLSDFEGWLRHSTTRNNCGKTRGIETALQLKKEGLPVRVVFLTAHEDSDFMAAALATGAVGYVLRRRLTSDLILSLRTVLRGDIFVSRPCPF